MFVMFDVLISKERTKIFLVAVQDIHQLKTWGEVFGFLHVCDLLLMEGCHVIPSRI